MVDYSSNSKKHLQNLIRKTFGGNLEKLTSETNPLNQIFLKRLKNMTHSMSLLLSQRRKTQISAPSQSFRTFRSMKIVFLLFQKVLWNSYVADRCHLIELAATILVENLVEFNYSPVQK